MDVKHQVLKIRTRDDQHIGHVRALFLTSFGATRYVIRTCDSFDSCSDPGLFTQHPPPFIPQLNLVFVTVATASATHAQTTEPLATTIISYSFACLSCFPQRKTRVRLIM